MPKGVRNVRGVQVAPLLVHAHGVLNEEMPDASLAAYRIEDEWSDRSAAADLKTSGRPRPARDSVAAAIVRAPSGRGGAVSAKGRSTMFWANHVAELVEMLLRLFRRR